MRIWLASEEMERPGGIAVSVRALHAHLKALGHEVETGAECLKPEAMDLVWTHGWGSDRIQSVLCGLVEKRQSGSGPKLWAQLHDYRDLCLTGRKAVGKSLTSCDRPLSGACFGIHLCKGCGKGRNYFKLFAKYQRIQKRLDWIRHADQVLVFSEAMLRATVSNQINPERVRKTPPWTDVLAVSQGGDAVASLMRPSRPLLLWVGRFVREKGPEIFVHLVQALRRDHGVDVAAVMVGDGSERTALEALVRSLNLSDVIQFPGWLEGDSLQRHFYDAHHLVMTSRWPEPFGLVGVEALAAGLPLVASDVGGTSEWADERMGGVRVRPEDAAGWVKASLRLLKDPAYRDGCGKKALAGYNERFSVVSQRVVLEGLLRQF